MFPAALTDPNIAFVLLVLGLLGVYWEVHAPGMMVPGILGVLLICAGAYGLYQDAPSWYGVTILVLALILLIIELRYYTHMVSGIAGAILFALGAMVLLTGPRHIAPSLAVAFAIAFGMIVIFLGFLGMRARKEKHLTGIETLIGKIGVSRTEINPEGTVFVQGAYWQARSDHTIPAGQRVSIESVQELVLFVKEA